MVTKLIYADKNKAQGAGQRNLIAEFTIQSYYKNENDYGCEYYIKNLSNFPRKFTVEVAEEGERNFGLTGKPHTIPGGKHIGPEKVKYGAENCHSRLCIDGRYDYGYSLDRD